MDIFIHCESICYSIHLFKLLYSIAEYIFLYISLQTDVQL